MCLGAIARLTEAWEERGTRVGRLDDGSIVSLAYLPHARPGEHVLVHLGIPVEVIDEQTAREAVELRTEGGVQ
jgi:hydrogenase expression/formation protein HypC